MTICDWCRQPRTLGLSVGQNVLTLARGGRAEVTKVSEICQDCHISLVARIEKAYEDIAKVWREVGVLHEGGRR